MVFTEKGAATPEQPSEHSSSNNGDCGHPENDEQQQACASSHDQHSLLLFKRWSRLVINTFHDTDKCYKVSIWSLQLNKLLRTCRTLKPNSRLGLIWKWFIAVHFHLNFHCCIISLITTDQFNVHIPRWYFGHLRNCTFITQFSLLWKCSQVCKVQSEYRW